MAVRIEELAIADRPESWAALGFEVEGESCVLGEVRLRFLGAEAGKGILSWSLNGAAGGDFDGLPTRLSERPPPPARPAHPNGIAAIDHLVAFTPMLDRTVAVLEEAGLDLRRIREEPTPAGAPRQAFFRLGETIFEVVQQPPDAIRPGGEDGPAFFWGLALLAPDLDATLADLGDRVGRARPAVQAGRRMATLNRTAGLTTPLALISPVASHHG